MPPKILSGIGAINQLEPHIANKGNKVLIVSDNVMTKIGNVARLSNLLDKCEISYEVYDKVDGEPTDVVVEKGVSLFKQTGCKFIIALGGGSPIDAAKAIGFMSVSNGKIRDYMGMVVDFEIPYLVAIPTTAGTGSEVTQFTIITDTESNVKMLLREASP